MRYAAAFSEVLRRPGKPDDAVGIAHAVAPGAPAALCGIALSELHAFPDRSFDVNPRRCPTCEVRAILN